MRVVDANVLISALLKAEGSPARIVSLWRSGELEIVVSEEVIGEVGRIFGRHAHPRTRDLRGSSAPSRLYKE